jgi:hypothetical protein
MLLCDALGPSVFGKRIAGARGCRTRTRIPPFVKRRGASFGFDVHSGEAVQVQIGTSLTSVEDARLNLLAEIPDWTFDRTAAAARMHRRQAFEDKLDLVFEKHLYDQGVAQRSFPNSSPSSVLVQQECRCNRHNEMTPKS